jgi:hypothetical protein
MHTHTSTSTNTLTQTHTHTQLHFLSVTLLSHSYYLSLTHTCTHIHFLSLTLTASLWNYRAVFVSHFLSHMLSFSSCSPPHYYTSSLSLALSLSVLHLVILTLCLLLTHFLFFSLPQSLTLSHHSYLLSLFLSGPSTVSVLLLLTSCHHFVSFVSRQTGKVIQFLRQKGTFEAQNKMFYFNYIISVFFLYFCKK